MVELSGVVPIQFELSFSFEPKIPKPQGDGRKPPNTTGPDPGWPIKKFLSGAFLWLRAQGLAKQGARGSSLTRSWLASHTGMWRLGKTAVVGQKIGFVEKRVFASCRATGGQQNGAQRAFCSLGPRQKAPERAAAA